jgi:hypothetical protein
MTLYTDQDAFWADATRRPDLGRVLDDGLVEDLGTLRRRSPESDYGTGWRSDAFPVPSARLSLIAYTGELYLYKFGSGGGYGGTFDVEKPHWPNGAIEVVGLLPIDTELLKTPRDPGAEGYWYSTADKLLQGWANQDPPLRLPWLRARLETMNLRPLGQR